MKKLTPVLSAARRIAALLLLCLSVAGPAHAAGSRDVLWNIITHCLDPTVASYCSTCISPRIESPCATGKTCKQVLEVWAENKDFVAIRDRKMCDCPEDFVHGLVMPRAKVTGVEDPRRPDGIWSFAWNIACDRIGDDDSMALVVNPAGMRDQDQLHVHLMRLKPDARQRFRPEQVGCVDRLWDVWKTAAQVAATAGFDDYGVLVTRRPGGGFLVVVDPVTPEKKYGIPRCN